MSSDKNCLLIGETCRTNRIGQRGRKETEEFGRGEGGFLMKEGYEMGGVRIQKGYRNDERMMNDWYRKGI